MAEIEEIREFLGCATPEAWLQAALQQVPTLLIDHAHCEKKAASTALNLMFRYVDRRNLLSRLAQLAREEMLHFEQVLELMDQHGVRYDHLSPARYANGLRRHIRPREPWKLVDTLLIGALIEARSCERFAALAPLLSEQEATADIGRYYRFLLKSEGRHYRDYLDLAREYSPEDISARLLELREIEAELITAPDPEFRFHSGVPSA